MKDNNFMINKCKELVKDYYNRNLVTQENLEKEQIKDEEIYVVWFCKTLQNFKALVSTDKADTRYYEITYNGNAKEYYLDCYTKQFNCAIKA